MAEDSELVVVFADERSQQMKVFCPLCSKVYNDPFITSCGHTFCKTCASSPQSICPIDNSALSLLVKNLAIAEEVGELEIRCRFGCRARETSGDPGAGLEYEADLQGCPVVVKLSDRHEHERECDFAPVQCPNNATCATMLRKDLAEHLKSCDHTRCPHHTYNCQFNGTAAQLEEHLKQCKFEGVKGVLYRMEEEVASLRTNLGKKDEAIQQLTSSLSELSSKMERVEKDSSVGQHRLERLEGQQSGILKDVTQAMNSVGIVMNELQVVQQQLGVAANFEPQHYFKCHGTFVGHKGPVWDLCKSGDLLFSASSDNTIKVWDLGELYAGPRTITGHDGIVLALCVEGDQLFSGSSDTFVKIWSIKKLELVNSFKAHDDPVCTLTCNEYHLFSGSLRSIKVWDIRSYQLVRTLPSQNHWVRALVACGKFLYSGSYRAIKIWSLDTLEVVHVLQCVGGSVYSLAVTDKHIICGTYENLIHIWDVRSHQDIGTLTGHVGAVYALAVFSAPGQTNRLFSASYDKTIRVWNMELMTCTQTMARHDGSVTCLILSKGRIFSGAVDNLIKAWQ